MKHVLALSACLLATPALADCVPVGAGLPGWQAIDFNNIAPNAWAESGGAVTVASDDSASLFYYTLTPGRSAPVLTWRWRVDQGVPATDLTRKGGDDRSMAVTVGFAYDSASASIGERMKRVVVESVAGSDAPGRILEFVWGGQQAVGTSIQSPYSGNAGRIIIQHPASDPTGVWVEERVDLAALYREVWGGEPTPVTQIALTADSDDTDGAIRASITDICFSG